MVVHLRRPIPGHGDLAGQRPELTVREPEDRLRALLAGPVAGLEEAPAPALLAPVALGVVAAGVDEFLIPKFL